MIIDYKIENYLFGCLITCRLDNLNETLIKAIEAHETISDFKANFKNKFRYYYLQRFGDLISLPNVGFSDGKLILLLSSQDIERRIEHGKMWNYDWTGAIINVIELALSDACNFKCFVKLINSK